jgi:hypothetical protein
MPEYKTKKISFELAGRRSMAQILPLLPALLQQNDEPGWEVCGTVIAPFYSNNPVDIGVVYRKTPPVREALRAAFMRVPNWQAIGAPTTVEVAGDLADAAIAVLGH